MYRSGSSNNLAGVQSPPLYAVLITGVERNALAIDDQRIASPHNEHVFVVIMRMRGRYRCLIASPKCHLASVSPIEEVSLDAGCRLVCGGDSVSRVLHELGKLVHAR